MTVKEVADAFGISTEKLFQDGYDRYGLLYSIGPPQVTHARYLKVGAVPIYAVRHAKDLEKLLTQHHEKLN